MSYPVPGRPWPGHSNLSTLASHAERERTVDVLKAGFSEGRLRHDEFQDRVARAYAARTLGELAVLVADLPQGPMPLPAAPGSPVALVPVPRPVPAAPSQANGKAVGALVCGAASVVTFGATGVPALVLGHWARAEIRRTGERGDGMAEAGLILGWVSVAGWAVLLLIMMVFTVT